MQPTSQPLNAAQLPFFIYSVVVLALAPLFSCYAFPTVENLRNEGAQATSLRLARNLAPVQ